jgi:predicted small integral membrane protein
MNLNWMAWTKPTAIFFIIIFCMLVTMTIWEMKRPGGAPKVGILHFETTRGDRLFISLLGSAYIHIIWLALFSSLALWWATALACIYALCVFRWV